MNREVSLPDQRDEASWVEWAGKSPMSAPELVVRRFELRSRGDRVSGRLLLPRQRHAPCPLILLQHGLGGSSDAPYLDTAGVPWVRRGVALACMDLPLHGARSEQKLADQIAAGAGGPPQGEPLGVDFARQALLDLASTLDAVSALEDIDEKRVAFAGFSLGAMLGAAFCALDPRPCAAALALCGAGMLPEAADPIRFVARISPRPLLMVNARSDEVISRAASEALYAAAEQPKRRLWFEGSHQTLPAAAMKAMWTFLAEALGVQSSSLTPGRREANLSGARGGIVECLGSEPPNL